MVCSPHSHAPLSLSPWHVATDSVHRQFSIIHWRLLPWYPLLSPVSHTWWWTIVDPSVSHSSNLCPSGPVLGYGTEHLLWRPVINCNTEREWLWMRNRTWLVRIMVRVRDMIRIIKLASGLGLVGKRSRVRLLRKSASHLLRPPVCYQFCIHSHSHTKHLHLNLNHRVTLRLEMTQSNFYPLTVLS